MLTFITVLHIIVVVLLVICVLLQDSKGGALGIGGGAGSSQSLFGATGASNFLVKATRWLGVLFAFTCISLTYFSSHRGGTGSVTDDYVPATAPATAPAETEKAPANGAETPAADTKTEKK